MTKKHDGTFKYSMLPSDAFYTYYNMCCILLFKGNFEGTCSLEKRVQALM